MGFVMVPSFFAWTSVLRGEDTTSAWERAQSNFLDTLYSSWALWGPGDLVLFGVVPPHLRVASSYSLEYAWVVAASFTSNREGGPKEAEGHAVQRRSFSRRVPHDYDNK